jgi:hypothetical protein
LLADAGLGGAPDLQRLASSRGWHPLRYQAGKAFAAYPLSSASFLAIKCHPHG